MGNKNIKYFGITFSRQFLKNVSTININTLKFQFYQEKIFNFCYVILKSLEYFNSVVSLLKQW